MSVSVHCPLMRRLQAPRPTDIIAGDSMDQLPNLGREQEMLLEMGLKSMDELFEDIPEDVRRADPSHSGPTVRGGHSGRCTRLLGANIHLDSRPSFLSAGLARTVPSMVPMLATEGNS